MSAEKLSKLNLWRIDCVGFILCLGTTFVAYGVSLGPRMEQRSTMDTQRAELVEKRQACADLGQSLAVLKDDVIHIRQDLEEMEVTLQPVSRINQRLATLTDILGEAHMKIDTMHTGSINQGPYCSFVSVDIVGQSDYLHYITALNQLHHQLPDMALVGFDLRGGAPEEAGQYTLNLFWYALPNSAGKDQ